MSENPSVMDAPGGRRATMRGRSRTLWLAPALTVLLLGPWAVSEAQVPIMVDPGAYVGHWLVDGQTPLLTGAQTVNLLPGPYNILVGGHSRIFFDVSGTGLVTIQPASVDSATGGANLLTFKNTPVTIDPQAYQGVYDIELASAILTGVQTLTLVPAQFYSLVIAGNSRINFDVSATGFVTVRPENVDSATGGANQLMFTNVSIHVTTSASAWNIDLVHVGAGSEQVTLVPAQSFVFRSGSEGQLVNIGAPCSASPSSFVLSGAGFTLACVPTTPVIACAGFEPPLAGDPVTVKGNRALPLRATLQDASGGAITSQDIVAPPVLQVVFTSAVGGPPVDVSTDALPAGQGTEGNQFVFSGDKWQFNLKTNTYTSAGSYALSMVSGNSAEYAISPSCSAVFVREP
jgi:hypothetical protein